MPPREGGGPGPSRPAAVMARRLLAPVGRHWVVIVGAIAVAGLIAAVDPAKVWAALTGSNPRPLIAMIPVVLLLYVVHGLAWRVALSGVGAPVGTRQAVEVTYVSQAFVFLPGGDLWRVPIVRSETDQRIEAGPVTASVVFDDLVYFMVLTVAMIPAATRVPALVIPIVAALLPQIAIFTVLLWSSLYEWIVARVGHLPLVRRFESQLALLGPSFRRLFTWRVLVPVLILDGIASVLAISLFGLALAAVHGTGASAQQIAFTYAAGQVASGLTVLPGALGAYEGMMTGLLAVQGVAAAAAAAAALLYRVVNDVLMALIGLAIAFVFQREYLHDLRRPNEQAAG